MKVPEDILVTLLVAVQPDNNVDDNNIFTLPKPIATRAVLTYDSCQSILPYSHDGPIDDHKLPGR